MGVSLAVSLAIADERIAGSNALGLTMAAGVVIAVGVTI